MASQLGITNGHAARMRYSRFKQHMEGIPAAPRKPRSNVPRPVKKLKLEEADGSNREGETMSGVAVGGEGTFVPRVKAEPLETEVAKLPQARSASDSHATAEKFNALSLSSMEVQSRAPLSLPSQLAQGKGCGPLAAFTAPSVGVLGESEKVLIKLEPGVDD